jgi:dTDP-glucose pyrophosphorylase/CBS domain-containing protein
MMRDAAELLTSRLRHKPQKTVGDFCVTTDVSVERAMLIIDRDGEGATLVIDENVRLLGTLTDGDIRRGLLNGVEMSAPVSRLLEAKSKTKFAIPVTAPAGTPDDELLRLMNENSIRHIPMLNESGQVVDLGLLRTLVLDQVLPLTGVVMAGGRGERLRPLTADMPKPMLTVGDKPLLERIVEQMQQSGIGRVCVTTHYKPEKITSHFGDGAEFGVTIDYVTEDQPLGTAGALRLLDRQSSTLLVVNGDILTRVDFRAMLDYHRESAGALTIGVRKHETTLPFGVVQCEGSQVTGIVEKPRSEVLINAGIYLVEPALLPMIPEGRRYDMTDLIRAALESGLRVEAFPIREFWLDVGRPEDYRQAEADVKAGRLSR